MEGLALLKSYILQYCQQNLFVLLLFCQMTNIQKAIYLFRFFEQREYRAQNELPHGEQTPCVCGFSVRRLSNYENQSQSVLQISKCA